MTTISLKDFLKTYTVVSNKFIDEYYYFYELCEIDKFGINVELVIKYLEYSDIKKFYERLRKNYKINYDFIIKRKIQKSQKGIRDVEYFLSLDCFEKICLTSRTPKGESVRDYFILLRKFINYYKSHFADGINKLAKSKKYVYIILVNKNKNIQKFGRTINMRKRLYNYATGKDKHPDIKFIMIVDNPIRVELCVKSLIDKYQFKNKQELYKIDYDVLKSAIFDCADLIKSLDEKVENSEKYDTYVVYDEFEENEYLDLDNNIIGYEKKPLNKLSKKSSKKPSKKPSKKSSKKSSKKLSKKSSKKLSKKSSKKSSKKPSKKPILKTTTAKSKAKLGRPKKLTNHIDV
jgi:phage anti-repressor protein